MIYSGFGEVNVFRVYDNLKNRPLKCLKEDITLFQRAFVKKEGHNDLLSIVTSAFQTVVNGESGQDVAHEELAYLERLVKELRDVAKEESEIESKVEEVLVHLNFNSRKYFQYYIARISRHVNREETLTGKLERLAYEYKKTCQIQCESNICYTKRYPSLRDVIGNWISEEISFLERKLQLTIAFPNSDSQVNKNFKLALNMSVAQVTCLIRGLMERKIILNTNLTELAGFLARIVVTKRSENISEGSFRRKYYNIEEGAKNSVIEMLNKTIDWLIKN